MSRETKLVKNTFILSIGTFLPKFAAFITLPILTGYLSKEQYGTYDLVTILVGLVLPIATLQIHTAAFRFLIEHKNDRENAKLYFSNILALVIPVSLVTLTVLFFVFPIKSVSIRIWICIYLFFDTLVGEVRQITRGLSRNLDYSISSIISAFTKMILAVVLVQFLKYELTGAIIALALSPVFSLTFLFFKVKVYELIDFKLVNKKVLKEMIAYSWPMVPNNLSGWVMRVSDRFVVTGFMGAAANAVYAVANKIPSLLSLAQTTFNLAWQENASIVSKDEDVGKYYSKMFDVMLRLYAGFLGLLIACTPVVFKIFVKGNYDEAYPQMPILFLAFFFGCMSAFLGGIYIAFKATKSVGLTTFAAAISNIVIDLALINWIGLYAASLSTLISYVFMFFYRMKNVKKLVHIEYDIKKFIVILSVLIVESVVSYINIRVLNYCNAVIGLMIFLILNKQLVFATVNKFKKLRSSRSKKQ